MTMRPAEVLSEHYGMQGAELVPTELGAINDNFFVECGRGRYVLKRYRPEHNPPDRIRKVCRVQASLRTRGVPVPEFIANTAGQVVTEIDGNCYVLAVRAPGRHCERGRVPLAAALSLGRTLGRIVALLAAGEVAEPYTMPPPSAARATARQLLSEAEARTEPVDAVAREVLRHKLTALERLAPHYPRIADLPAQWVHGDYQLTNVLFDEAGAVTAVLDFDNLRCRPRGLEFMRALDLCFDRRPGELTVEALAFFHGYAEIVRPSPDEVSLYPLMRAYVDACAGWPLSTRYLEPEAYQPRWDRYIKPPTDWWERNLERVSAQLLTELATLPAGTDGAGPNSPVSNESGPKE